MMSYQTFFEVDHKFCLLEKQQLLNWLFKMERRVHPLSKSSMAQKSLFLISP